MMEVPGKRAAHGVKLCDVCELGGKQKQADGFCSDCNENMCTNCFQVHLTARPCRAHIFDTLDKCKKRFQPFVRREYCNEHKTETLRYFCPVHDTLACGDCVVLNHSICQPVFISDWARNFETSSEFMNIQLRIKALEAEVNKCEKINKEYKPQKETVLNQALGEIRHFRQEMIEFLDNAEKDIIDEAKRLTKENDTTVAEIEHKITQIKLRISELNTELDPKSYHGETLFIRLLERKSSLSEIEQILSSIKSTSTLKEIAFAPDQALKEVQKLRPKLGCLKTESQLQFRKQSSPVGSVDKKRKHETETTSTKYMPPDPRACGFDVGTRVKWSKWDTLFSQNVWGRGTVTKVNPLGYVDVTSVRGSGINLRAGAGGKFDVRFEK